MASQWVDDPSWGGIASGLASAVTGGGAGHTADIYLKAEQIKKLREERARANDEYNALQEAITRIGPRYDAMNPPYAETGQPYRGNINAVLADDISRAPEFAPFFRQREQARADEILATRLSKTPAQLYQTRGLGQVTTSGVPTDPAEWARVQTQLKAEQPDPFSGTKNIHNYSYQDPQTGEVTQGRTLNGVTDMTTGRPIPQSAAVFSGQPRAEASPFGDQKAAQESLGRLALSVRQGKPMTIQDVERARISFDTAFPQTGAFVDIGGRKTWQITRKDIVPAWALPIADLINDYHSGAHERPYTGGNVNDVLADNVPAPQPIVPYDPNRPRQVGPGVVDPGKLADDFRAEPPVKLYNEAVIAWNSLAEHAKGDTNGRYSNSTDLAIIYGIAKLMDPGSVVREGELNLARTLGSLPEGMRAWFTRVVEGTGILPARVRADLLFEGERRMQVYLKGLDLAVKTYADRAQQGGVDPRLVITDLQRPAPLDYREVLQRGEQSDVLQQEQPVIAPTNRERARELVR